MGINCTLTHPKCKSTHHICWIHIFAVFCSRPIIKSSCFSYISRLCALLIIAITYITMKPLNEAHTCMKPPHIIAGYCCDIPCW